MFLDQSQALTAIRTLLQTGYPAKLAVAFWGNNAAERLGIDQQTGPIQIICNLESGCCNPAELRRLMTFPGVELRTHPRLHAKVYWTQKGAVIGSSNASTNGLAVEGEPLTGWAEGNLLIEDAAVLETIDKWFHDRLLESFEITGPDLDRADELWRTRSRMAPLGISKRGLLELVRATLDHSAWNNVKIAYWQDPLNAADKAELAEHNKNKSGLQKLSAYSDWNDRIDPGDWIIDMAVQGQKASFGGYWRALEPDAGHSRMRLVTRSTTIALPGLGRLKLANEEKALLSAATEWALNDFSSDGGRNAMVDIRTVAIEPSPVWQKGTKKAFESAMEKIYTDAKAVGYKASEYKKMLDRDGGLLTAQKLINAAKPSSGFTNLWEKGHLDLTVEYLILKPEWRELFLDTELSLAKKRLSQFGGTEPDQTGFTA